MNERRYHVVLNAQSGGAAKHKLDEAGLARAFADHGLTAWVDADSAAPLPDRVAAALASEAQVIVAAGGDGTVTALAAALAGTEKALAILPLGTANLLARDLGIPLDLQQAIGGLATMEPRRIDIGEVNGQVFLHKAVIGVVPGIAAAREQLRGRDDWRAKLGFLRYFVRRLGRARRFAVEIATPGGPPRIERAQAVAVANNAYDEGVARFFSRQRLDGGALNLYVIKRLGLSEVLKLTTAMAFGRWRQNEALSIEEVEAVTIRSRRERLKVMIDGEIETLATPLSFRIRPGALSVLAPPQAADAAGASADVAMAGP